MRCAPCCVLSILNENDRILARHIPQCHKTFALSTRGKPDTFICSSASKNSVEEILIFMVHTGIYFTSAGYPHLHAIPQQIVERGSQPTQTHAINISTRKWRTEREPGGLKNGYPIKKYYCVQSIGDVAGSVEEKAYAFMPSFHLRWLVHGWQITCENVYITIMTHSPARVRQLTSNETLVFCNGTRRDFIINHAILRSTCIFRPMQIPFFY